MDKYTHENVTHIFYDKCGYFLNYIFKNETEFSGRYVDILDTAHLLENSVSFVHALQGIITNVHDALCGNFWVHV